MSAGQTVEPETASARILIASVGYRDLRDLSLGPVLLDHFAHDPGWPGVQVEDLSYGPIAVMHRLEAQGPYDRIIFVAGVKRQRSAGQVYCYRWQHQLPDPEEIQARVAEALMGVISLDNLLIIATYFGKLPADVIVVEVEAVDDGWGEGFTPQVQATIPEVIEVVRSMAGS